MDEVLTISYSAGLFSGLVVGLILAWVALVSGYNMGLGRIMELKDIPRNTRLQFRGLVGNEGEYFLLADAEAGSDKRNKNGFSFSIESRIAETPNGDQLTAMKYGEQFMVVENRVDDGPVAIEFMKLIE